MNEQAKESGFVRGLGVWDASALVVGCVIGAGIFRLSDTVAQRTPTPTLFLAAWPFAKVQLPKLDAFIPIYESALIINDLVTAVLLFGQFSILRSRAMLVLASGYLFTALLVVALTGAAWFVLQGSAEAVACRAVHIVAARVLLGLIVAHVLAVASHVIELA